MHSKVFIQIGTKDGADEFQKIVREEKPDLVILIEPNEEHNDAIFKNYLGIDIHLENVIITAEEKDYAVLVHPVGLVNGLEYDSGKFSLLPMDDWGHSFVELSARAKTFNQICREYDIAHVDFLQIDTEGYDAEIIKSIDFDSIKIDKIKYEIWNFPSDRFTRHGDKGRQYGIEGMRDVHKLLRDRGYQLEYLPYDIIATHEKLVS